jgi:hypothetical protein
MDRLTCQKAVSALKANAVTLATTVWHANDIYCEVIGAQTHFLPSSVSASHDKAPSEAFVLPHPQLV